MTNQISVTYGPVKLAQFLAELYKQGIAFKIHYISGDVHRVDFTGY